MLLVKSVVNPSDILSDKHPLRGQPSKFAATPWLWAEPSGRQLEKSLLNSAWLP